MKKLSKKTSISIGIPAYNEEANIKELIKSLLAQDHINYHLREILVVSDGSTDKTVKIVSSFKNKSIRLISGRDRLGKSMRLNQILKSFESDMIFLIDADITIKDQKLISRIIAKFNPQRDGIVSIKLVPITGESLIEKSLNYSVLIQDEIRKNWNNSRNYLSFRGGFLGLDKSFAKNIHFPEGLIADDAFMFFSAKKMGYKTKYFSNLQAFYKSPSTLQDHVLQSNRFKFSQTNVHKYLDKKDIEYNVPLDVALITMFKYFIKNPFYFVTYSLISIYVLSQKNITLPTWTISSSTKSRFSH